MPRSKKVVDTSNMAKIQCIKCEKFHIFTDYVKTKKKDENGENVRRKVCKHCTYGHITTGRDTAKTHLNAIRHRCKKKNLKFDMTLEDLKIPEFCPILGIPLLQEWGAGNGVGQFNSPSVDKVVPMLGYVSGNVQVVSNRANMMKKDATIENIRSLLAYMEKNMNVAA